MKLKDCKKRKTQIQPQCSRRNKRPLAYSSLSYASPISVRSCACILGNSLAFVCLVERNTDFACALLVKTEKYCVCLSWSVKLSFQKSLLCYYQVAATDWRRQMLYLWFLLWWRTAICALVSVLTLPPSCSEAFWLWESTIVSWTVKHGTVSFVPL